MANNDWSPFSGPSFSGSTDSADPLNFIILTPEGTTLQTHPTGNGFLICRANSQIWIQMMNVQPLASQETEDLSTLPLMHCIQAPVVFSQETYPIAQPIFSSYPLPQQLPPHPPTWPQSAWNNVPIEQDFSQLKISNKKKPLKQPLNIPIPPPQTNNAPGSSSKVSNQIKPVIPESSSDLPIPVQDDKKTMEPPSNTPITSSPTKYVRRSRWIRPNTLKHVTNSSKSTLSLPEKVVSKPSTDVASLPKKEIPKSPSKSPVKSTQGSSIPKPAFQRPTQLSSINTSKSAVPLPSASTSTASTSNQRSSRPAHFKPLPKGPSGRLGPVMPAPVKPYSSYRCPKTGQWFNIYRQKDCPSYFTLAEDL